LEKELWKGNEAIAEAAVRAGCRYFFGYPITPQNEIPEYMSMRMPQVGGCYLQSESEIGAINMVYGASGAGARVMTSSSSPGISLKQEGISYLAGAELPAVIVNVMRGGPGLGSIQPAQSDYFQATRGGGNGDYRTIVLAPNSIQEAVALTQEAFDLADLYRTPVMILADGMIGQMMEPIEWTDSKKRELPEKTWATTGTGGTREHNIINSLFIDAKDCEEHNIRLDKKYRAIEEMEVRWEEQGVDGAELIFVAYGTPARITMSAIGLLAKEGVRAGLFRPITLWPYPYKRLGEIARQPFVKHIVTVEMSMGQMIDDVRLAVEGACPVSFVGRAGGMVPTPADIVKAARQALGR
jgi:2-oxoglutarate ferredoxin oxidoreductase subunit alpha